MGAFRMYASTGADHASVGVVGQHATWPWGVQVLLLLEGLRWRYPGHVAGCCCRRLHWAEGDDRGLLVWLLAPLWTGA